MIPTDVERAHLRLRAFALLGNFGYKDGEPVKFGDQEIQPQRPLSLKERQKWADELVQWALSPVPPGEAWGWRV